MATSLIEPSPYLSTAQVLARFGGVNRMWLYRAVRLHGFPKPLKLPGASGLLYPRQDVEAWEASRLHANDNQRVKLHEATL